MKISLSYYLTHQIPFLILLLMAISTFSEAYAQQKEVRITTPSDGSEILLSSSESIPAEREIKGDVTGFKKEEIEGLGLRIVVSIKTDKWYPQGIARVRSDGTWILKKAYFGGAVHHIEAALKDKNDSEIASTTVVVTLIQ